MEHIPGQKFTVSHDSPLLKYLYEIFPGQSKTGVKAYLSNGQINVNGKKVTAFDQPLFKGDTLIVLPKGLAYYNEVKHAAREEIKDYGIEILFEDDDIIVVNKRSGMPVVGTGKSAGRTVDIDEKGGKASLDSQKKESTVYSVLCDYIRTKVRAEKMSTKHKIPWKPSHVFIVHRLDRDTSGVLVFAKNENTQRLLQDGWNNIVKVRAYVGILEGVPQARTGRVESWLQDNPKSLKVTSKVDLIPGEDNPADWQKAVTRYEVTDTVKRDAMTYSMVKFELETGRKNQVRVHSAVQLRCPIVGDKKYGAKTNPIGRLALHACTLAFIHPVTGKLMTFRAKLPKEFGKI